MAVRSSAARLVSACAVATLVAGERAARAQTLDGSASDGVPPGIPALYCPDCEKPERVRVLGRLGVPFTFGAVLGRAGGDGFHALQLGVRPELTVGRIGERSQHAGRVHVGAYGEALARFGSSDAGGTSGWPRALLGGGATVALTTGEITGASLSLGAFAAHGDDGWRAGGAASLFVGAWMPDDAIALVPSLGVRVDARWGGAAGDAERSVAVSLQVDPVMVGLLIVGLAG